MSFKPIPEEDRVRIHTIYHDGSNLVPWREYLPLQGQWQKWDDILGEWQSPEAVPALEQMRRRQQSLERLFQSCDKGSTHIFPVQLEPQEVEHFLEHKKETQTPSKRLSLVDNPIERWRMHRHYPSMLTFLCTTTLAVIQGYLYVIRHDSWYDKHMQEHLYPLQPEIHNGFRRWKLPDPE